VIRATVSKAERRSVLPVFGFAVPAQADPGTLGSHYHVDNHDESNTTNGFVDLPF
jgi:hypothetical protein